MRGIHTYIYMHVRLPYVLQGKVGGGEHTCPWGWGSPPPAKNRPSRQKFMFFYVFYVIHCCIYVF